MNTIERLKPIAEYIQVQLKGLALIQETTFSHSDKSYEAALRSTLHTIMFLLAFDFHGPKSAALMTCIISQWEPLL